MRTRVTHFRPDFFLCVICQEQYVRAGWGIKTCWDCYDEMNRRHQNHLNADGFPLKEYETVITFFDSGSRWQKIGKSLAVSALLGPGGVVACEIIRTPDAKQWTCQVIIDGLIWTDFQLTESAESGWRNGMEHGYWITEYYSLPEAAAAGERLIQAILDAHHTAQAESTPPEDTDGSAGIAEIDAFLTAQAVIG